MESVPFALWCFVTNHDDFEEAVVTAVNAGGDTDTNASITGALAGALNGVDAIPRHWRDGLVHPTRGRDYLMQLGERLSQV
jgi:ADP-ribosylglycohydrolase